MLLRGSIWAGAVALAAICGSGAAHAQSAFTLSSSTFKDGERSAVKYAGNNKANPNCVGENISPALACDKPRDGTKSFALLTLDPGGPPPGCSPDVRRWRTRG